MCISLKPKQITACTLIAAGETITEVAKKINVTRSTIYVWQKKDTHFIAYLNQLKSENVETARTQIQATASLAIETLAKVMTTSKNDMAKVQAAKEVLSMAGLTKDDVTMYGWGIGEESPAKVEAGIASQKVLDGLKLF